MMAAKLCLQFLEKDAADCGVCLQNDVKMIGHQADAIYFYMKDSTQDGNPVPEKKIVFFVPAE